MQIPSLVAIQQKLQAQDVAALPKLRIVVLRNATVETLAPYLRYLALQMGYDAQVRFGEFDRVVPEAIDAQDPVVDAGADVVAVFLRLDPFAPRLAHGFAALAAVEARAEADRVRQTIEAIVRGLRRKTRAVILWHGFELPAWPDLGVLDSQGGLSQAALVHELNQAARQVLHAVDDAYFVDLNLCLLRLGAAAFYDLRYWHVARAPFSSAALREIAHEDFKILRALKGKQKKCLVLDCDQTLWGGIVGEDGLAGIQLGRSHPGSMYLEFQTEILNLYHRGILLALCSKNNPEDVWQVFREHPEMQLRERHIATAQINWRDKAANLRQIAADLNLGVDSLVFADDSAFEIGLVREVLPEVETLHLPPERPAEYGRLLAACGLFDSPTLSDEDRDRGAMYRAEAQRKELERQTTDVESYYRGLAMEVVIERATELTVPRIVQLLAKTNQFNLTSRRHGLAQVKEWAAAPDADVFCLSLRDRFGGMGIVGAAIVRHEAAVSRIDSFLLSCRVIGRGVEDVLLAACVAASRRRGKSALHGCYLPTRKNGQVADFYPRRGFVPAPATETGVAAAGAEFTLPASAPCPAPPDYFRSVVTPQEAPCCGTR